MKRLVLSVGVLALLAGCGREFEPYWRILDFRVLAVRSSYPELRPGQIAEFEALTYTNSEGPISYQWEWCPLKTNGGDNFECPITADDLAAAMPDSEMLPPLNFDLGTAATASFAYPAPQPMLLEFCKQIQAFAATAPAEIAAAVPVVDCARGLDVSIRLTTRQGGKTIVTGKKITLWLGADSFNQNPEIIDVQIRPANAEVATFLRAQGIDWVQDPALDDGLWWTSIPANRPLDVYGNVLYEVRSLVEPNSIDIWTPPAPQGAEEDYLPPELEALVFRWMTTTGEYDPAERVYKDTLNTLERASIVEFKLNKRGSDKDFDDDGLPDASDPCVSVPVDGDRAEDDCTVSVWSIVRDGRYGTGWAPRTLNVVGVRR